MRLLAPNGKPSKLTPEQYWVVRTDAFKQWFGDWEKLEMAKVKDPAMDEVTLANLSKGVSKVVDENGEPLVVWHGTILQEDFFNEFRVVSDDDEFSAHFGNKEQALYRINHLREYFNKQGKEYVKPFFLNIKNFYESADIGRWYANTVFYEVIYGFGLDYPKTQFYAGLGELEIEQRTIYDIIDIFENNGYDGIAYDNIYETEGLSYLVFHPNQIKLADGTNTTFDESNPDIRYAEGGEVNSNSFMKWYVQWYKGISAKMNIVFALPSVIAPYKEENVVVLDVFEKINQNIDAKPYLQQIVEKADEYGVVIYLEPTPRHNRFQDNLEKRKKITREYLIEYYKRFGFQLTPNKQFMKRLPKSNPDIRFEGGGITKKTNKEILQAYESVGFKVKPDGVISKNGIDVTLFTNKVYEVYNGNPIVYDAFEDENVDIIELISNPDKQNISKGIASKVLGDIIEVSEKLNRNLQLYPYPLKGSSLNQEQLTSWYERKGFQMREDGIMVKSPKKELYKNGGKMKSVSNGTITVGASHDEGGIPVYNKGTGQMLEVEGGEGIINKRSMALKKEITLNGEKMTPCEAASEINQMAGGVAYDCDNAKGSKERYEGGGEFQKGLAAEQEHEQTLHSLYNKQITPSEAIEDIVDEHLSEDDQYYSKLRGITDDKNIPKTTKQILLELEPHRHKHECWCDTKKFDNGGETEKDLSDIDLPKNLDDYDILGEKGIYQEKPTVQLSEQDKINAQKLGNAIKKMQELINTDYKPIILADNENKKLHRYVEKVRHLNLYNLGWRTNVGVSKAWAGICMSGGKQAKREIQLSYNFIVGDDAFEENLEDVMLHEIAHAIVAELFILNPFDLPLDKLKPSRVKDMSLYDMPLSIIDQTHSESGGHGIMWAAVCESISKGFICDMFYRLAEKNELMSDYKYKCIRCSNEEYGKLPAFASKCSKCGTPVLIIKNKL